MHYLNCAAYRPLAPDRVRAAQDKARVAEDMARVQAAEDALRLRTAEDDARAKAAEYEARLKDGEERRRELEQQLAWLGEELKGAESSAKRRKLNDGTCSEVASA